jgi:type VI secretion system protein ImpG
MDSRLIQLYDRELQYLRERSAEFAHYRPDTAQQLGLESEAAGACQDPHVERLLEGTAFLAARVHRKLEAEFPDLTQAILETVYPHYVRPFPACGIAQLMPDPSTANELLSGKTVPRHTRLIAPVLNDSNRSLLTDCVFRTVHDLTLWPFGLVEAAYLGREWATWGLLDNATQGALRLRLNMPGKLTFADLKGCRSLTVYIKGLGGATLPARLYELIINGALNHGLIKTLEGAPAEFDLKIEPAGFADDEALLPTGPNSFQGYRLLREFFGFPARFMFFRLSGLEEGLARCGGTSVADLVIPLQGRDESLVSLVHADSFGLYCVPVANLFEKTTHPIPVELNRREFEVVPDRNRRLEFEVFQVNSVAGHGLRTEQVREFSPFFYAPHRREDSGAFFAVRREARSLTREEIEEASVPSYLGSELYLSLVDTKAPPFSPNLRAITAEVLCTNRHLPLRIQPGSLLRPEAALPCASVRLLSERCGPQTAILDGELLWRIISHLSLNFLSLLGGPADTSTRDATVLRDVLRVYSDLLRPSRPDSAQSAERWIQSMLTIAGHPIIRRLPDAEENVFARGLQVTLGLADEGLSEIGLFLFGSVLERFLARFAGINSFIETVLTSDQRGVVKHWPARLGQRFNL